LGIFAFDGRRAVLCVGGFEEKGRDVNKVVLEKIQTLNNQ
jgi:hypothetical protein